MAHLERCAADSVRVAILVVAVDFERVVEACATLGARRVRRLVDADNLREERVVVIWRADHLHDAAVVVAFGEHVDGFEAAKGRKRTVIAERRRLVTVALVDRMHVRHEVRQRNGHIDVHLLDVLLVGAVRALASLLLLAAHFAICISIVLAFCDVELCD